MSSIPFIFRVSAFDLSADVTDAIAWTATTHGGLCGCVTEADMETAVDSFTDEFLRSYGGKAAVKKLMPTLFKMDVDSNGDGKVDAKSISLDFASVSATVVGVTQGQ